MDSDDISKSAVEWVKRHRRELFNGAIESSCYDVEIKEDIPAATFMAGTPGAGKTEVSKRFIEHFAVRPIRIDADEFRSKIPGYTGSNSNIIQTAATFAVEKVLDQAFEHGYSFVLDGTFAYKNAIMNLKRAMRRGYTLQIFYIYQDPSAAWGFTKKREAKEGRNVPVEAFIRSYFESRENVRKAKLEFGDAVNLTLVTKNYESNTEQIHADVHDIDSYIGRIYNEDELKGILL